MIEVNNLPTKITATAGRRRAFEGARYVINCVRIGGLEAFADDIRIPLKYGVDQCVGDTICAGGILYGQRNDPGHPRFLQATSARSPSPDALLPQLRQPDGDEHLGGDRSRRRRHGRPVPRRPARLAADRRRARREGPARGRHTSAPASTTRPGTSICGCTGGTDRQRRTDRGIRTPSGYSQQGKGAHRRAEALRRLFDRKQRPPVRILALVSQAPGRDPPLDRHVGLDPWRDRRLSPASASKGAIGSRPISRYWRRPRSRSTPKRSSEHASHIIEAWKPGASIAATSTSATTA